ncbi:E3 SUMO-protein ligase KIAA1586-like [Ptychodera flava]
MFTADGAEVMQGKKNGVISLFKATDSEICMEQHCCTHREALAVSHAYTGVKYFTKLEGTLKAIYAYFARSSTRQWKLKAVYEVLNMKFVKIKRIHEIRWLARGKAVTAVINGYEALVVYFGEEASKDADPTAAGIYKQLCERRFLLSLFFLGDLLGELDSLNRGLQTTKLHPCQVLPKVTGLRNKLSDMYLEEPSKISWGPQVLQLKEDLERNKYEGLHKTSTDEESFIGDVQDLVKRVTENLDSRFTEKDTMKAFGIFHPDKIPNGNLLKYGEDSIKQLHGKYKSKLPGDINDLMTEWDAFKYSELQELSNFNVEQVCISLTGLQHQYPNLCVLAEIYLVFQDSSVPAEQLFSMQNDTKTKKRNQLTSDTLDKLLRCKILCGSLEDFPYEDAFTSWRTKSRRYMEKDDVPVASDSSSDSD